MIKDYAKKKTIDPAISRWHWSAIVLVVVALIIVTVFVVALLSAISINKFGELSQIQVNPVAPLEKVESAKPKIIVQPSESDFTFPVILKNAEVTPPLVKVYKSTPKDPNKKTSHLLQVASFKSELDAKELKKLLTIKKLPNVEVNQFIAESGAVWFRVTVGPFQNRSRLNKAQDILVQMNYSPLVRKEK